MLAGLIKTARDQGASDLHLEPGLPAAIRVRGSLRTVGEAIPGATLQAMAQEVISQEDWPTFLHRRSWDLSRTLQRTRCRINVFFTSRGIGFSIRLLASFEANLEKLNLHPDLLDLTRKRTGLILVSGPTGSGKSSTMAALIEEINLAESRHIITLESPIEYNLRPKHSYIRQREVGRDTPSFEQGLLDALREDPDVLMVGEMRDPETMRLTLNAAETGHLVLATIHSASCVEALQRMAAAFPSEVQSAVRAQLADCLVAVLAQHLQFRNDLNGLVPELEILTSTHPVKHHIRAGEFFKIPQAMETGADQGMWTRERYQNWMQNRSRWYQPSAEDQTLPDGEAEAARSVAPALKSKPSEPGKTPATPPPAQPSSTAAGISSKRQGPIEIQPAEGGLDEVLREFED